MKQKQGELFEGRTTLFPRPQQQRDLAKKKRAEMQVAGQWFRHLKATEQQRKGGRR